MNKYLIIDNNEGIVLSSCNQAKNITEEVMNALLEEVTIENIIIAEVKWQAINGISLKKIDTNKPKKKQRIKIR